MEFALPPAGWGGPGLVCVACPSADVDVWKGRPRETFRKTMRATQSGFAAPHVSLMRSSAVAWRVLSSGCGRSRAPASHPFSSFARSLLIRSQLIHSYTYPFIPMLWLQSATAPPQNSSEASTAHHPAQRRMQFNGAARHRAHRHLPCRALCLSPCPCPSMAMAQLAAHRTATG